MAAAPSAPSVAAKSTSTPLIFNEPAVIASFATKVPAAASAPNTVPLPSISFAPIASAETSRKLTLIVSFAFLC